MHFIWEQWGRSAKIESMGCRECQLSRAGELHGVIVQYNSVFQNHEISRAYGKTHVVYYLGPKLTKYAVTAILRVRKKPRGFANWH